MYTFSIKINGTSKTSPRLFYVKNSEKLDSASPVVPQTYYLIQFLVFTQAG